MKQYRLFPADFTMITNRYRILKMPGKTYTSQTLNFKTGWKKKPNSRKIFTKSIG